MEAYIQLIEDMRGRCNIIGKNEVVYNHIVDSLSPFDVIAERHAHYCNTHKNTIPTFVDLGTGAGLPGIPLAIAFSYSQLPSTWILLDKSRKKINFINSVIATLTPFLQTTQLRSTCITLHDWHDPPPIHFLISRAFRPLKDIIIDMKNFAPYSELFLYKGKMAHIEQELASLTEEHKDIIKVEHIYPLYHERDKERHLIHATWR